MIKSTAYGKAREAGVCARCGVPSTTPRCSSCNQKMNEQVKQMRKARKEAGKCIQCKADSFGQTLCPSCNAAARMRKEGLDKFEPAEVVEWIGRRVHETITDVEADRVVAIEDKDYAKAFSTGEQMKVLQRIAKDLEIACLAIARG